MDEIILKTTELTKKYNNKAVVDNLNIEIKKGEIFGLLGPNGAGKSTTLNMICSIVRPTAGEIEVLGKNPWKQKKEVIHKIGYIPQELAVHGKLKAWENVELFTSLYGIKGQELKKSINESINDFKQIRNHFEDTIPSSILKKEDINVKRNRKKLIRGVLSQGIWTIPPRWPFIT